MTLHATHPRSSASISIMFGAIVLAVESSIAAPRVACLNNPASIIRLLNRIPGRIRHSGLAGVILEAGTLAFKQEDTIRTDEDATIRM